MLRLDTTLVAAAGLLAIPSVQAIGVAPGSPCETDCGNVLDATARDDLVCDQNAYSGHTGQLFEGCIQCEMGSGYSTANNESDTKWLLYNMRYVLNYCLWDVILGPCITSKACGTFKDAVQYQNLSTTAPGYGFCSEWPVDDFVDLEGCNDCLRAADQEFLSNFITVLQAGCEQKPAPGVTLGLDGGIFSTEMLNITSPSPRADVNPDWLNQGPLGLGGKVGIAVGGFVAILILLGCCVVWRGKKRRRAFLKTLDMNQGRKGWPSPQARAGEMNETPVSQRPLRGWDDSPQSAHSQTFPRYFSPYSSQYNSPVSANDALNMQWPQMHAAPVQGIGMALSDHAARSQYMTGGNGGGGGGGMDKGQYFDAYSPEDQGKGKGIEAYEMDEVDSSGSDSRASRAGRERHHPVPPVLGHPGYGRNGYSPPQTYGLTDEDAQKGYAI